MWSNPWHYLSVKIRITGHAFPGFTLPLPLWVLSDMLEDLADLAALIAFFLPHRLTPTASVRAAALGLEALTLLFRSMEQDAPCDLVDVTTPQAIVRIRLR